MSLFCTQVVHQALTVSNPSQARANVTWTSSDPAVDVQPSAALLASGREQEFQVLIRGIHVGKRQAELVCSVEHGDSQAVEVTATVTGTHEMWCQSAGVLSHAHILLHYA